MKCATIDTQTKLRAKIDFTNCRLPQEETAIKYLTRLGWRVNEARKVDNTMSERRF